MTALACTLPAFYEPPRPAGAPGGRAVSRRGPRLRVQAARAARSRCSLTRQKSCCTPSMSVTGIISP